MVVVVVVFVLLVLLLLLSLLLLVVVVVVVSPKPLNREARLAAESWGEGAEAFSGLRKTGDHRDF